MKVKGGGGKGREEAGCLPLDPSPSCPIPTLLTLIFYPQVVLTHLHRNHV